MSVLLAFVYLLMWMGIHFPNQELYTYTYGDSTTLNEGFFIVAGPPDDDVFNAWCGYETRGEEGWFCNVE